MPSLYTALSAGKQANNSSIYGENANAFIVYANDLVEIRINNLDDGAHPIHLHGHAMSLVARSPGIYASPRFKRGRRHGKTSGSPPAILANTRMDFISNSADTSKLPKIPMRRDTWLVAPSGYTVFRYRALNPGVWLLHCHMVRSPIDDFAILS